MNLNSWRGRGQRCCFRHSTLKSLKSPNQRWRTGWVACGSHGTWILVPGIVQNERTFNPHPLFPAISLQCRPTPPPLLCRTTKQTSLCHSLLRVHHSEVVKPLTLSPDALQHCSSSGYVLGFSCREAVVFTSWHLLSLRPITLSGLCPLAPLLCVTEYPLINQTQGKTQGKACQQLIDTQVQL